MASTCCSLRAFAPATSPLCLVTATMRSADMARVARSMDMSENPVLIHASPVHDHVKYSIIPRPSNAFGFDGKDNLTGMKPGLLQLLERIYLNDYFRDKEDGRQPKKCLFFFRGFKKMLDLYTYLADRTGLRTADVADHVMIHSDLSLATEKVVVERLNQYEIILALLWKQGLTLLEEVHWDVKHL